MESSRGQPEAADLLEAIAASLETGLALPEALRRIGRAGPASARAARQISDAVRGASLPLALHKLAWIPREALPVLEHGEAVGRLPSALRWAATRAWRRRDRRRALASALLGPLALAMLGLLAESLPAAFLGSLGWWPLLRPVATLAGATAILLLGGPRLVDRLPAGLRSHARRVPFVERLVRLADEAELAGLVAALADGQQLGAAPAAARFLPLGESATALASVAADASAPIPTLSEPVALALATGLVAGDLPSRFSALHQELDARLTQRLRLLVRVAAFAVLAVVAIQGVRKLTSGPLPGLGGDLGNLPEMKELEHELELLGH